MLGNLWFGNTRGLHTTDADKFQSYVQCMKYLKIDIIGVAETHLINNPKLDVTGYKWFGYCHRNMHHKAHAGLGVEFLASDNILKRFPCEDS